VKTLAKEHQILTLTRAGPEWNTAVNIGAWRKLGPNSFLSSTYFDLAGMAMDDKTLFFEAAGVQTVLSPLANNTGAGDSCVIMDLMSTRQLTDSQILLTVTFGNFAGNGTSDGQGPLSFEETIYARTQMFVRHVDTSAWGYITMTDENFFGSMEPTASDRIYSYRLVIPSTGTAGTDMDQLTIYPARHLLKSTAKEEPTHEYLMRLMRSYQLQQSPDVD
jgi:hypothetical protein